MSVSFSAPVRARNRLFPTLAFAMLASLAAALSPASAHEFKIGNLTIEHPWTRATPKGAKVAAGYFVIVNNGTAPDRLTAVSADFCDHVELHNMTVADGVMTMRPLDGGLEIAPGGKVAFKPSAYHVMFMDIKAPLQKGAKMKGTLVFEKAGAVPVEFAVEAIGAQSGDDAHSH